MELETYQQVKQSIIDKGFEEDIHWAEHIKPPEDAWHFAREYVFVVCNSGMKFQIAVKIFERVMEALTQRRSVATVFGHKGKAAAITKVWRNRQNYFDTFKVQPTVLDKLAYLRSLPWIGDITKYHLAKNLGVDCAKPDRHLVRIAERYGTETHALCAHLARLSGDRVATVDVVLWRAAAIGVL